MSENDQPLRQRMDEAELAGKCRQLPGALMSYIDFQPSVSITELILKQNLHEGYPRENRILLETLNSAMIVTYCRPFLGNRGEVLNIPARFIRDLSDDEREVHQVAMDDRNQVLAHSDGGAWKMTPGFVELYGRNLLLPYHRGVHRPLFRKTTERLRDLALELRDATFTERERLEEELHPHVPRFEYGESEAADSG